MKGSTICDVVVALETGPKSATYKNITSCWLSLCYPQIVAIIIFPGTQPVWYDVLGDFTPSYIDA